MKNRTLVDEFIDLIDGYKINKIDDLVKKIKADLSQLVSGNSELDIKFSNALEPLNLNDVQAELTAIYSVDLSEAFNAWSEYQGSREYKSQSLRTKIVNNVKKALPDQDTKDVVKGILDRYKLNYNLNSSLKIIKEELPVDSIALFEEHELGWLQKLNEINEDFDYSNWLDDKSFKAKGVGFSTHIAKLTHSGISGASNIFFNEPENKNYLSTASLKNKPIEISQVDNKLAPIGKLLQLRNNNESLSEQLEKGDLAVFEQFAKDDEQLSCWRNGFLAVFSEKELSTHYLAKQIYFPINHNDHCDNENYHLVSPMMSSSLDQAIFEKVNFAKYSKDMVEIRKKKREGTYHTSTLVSYPNLATLKVTASNPGNASPLNGTRSGKRYLFPSTPPVWKVIKQPPLKQKSIFSGEFEKRAWKSTRELQKYLIELQSKEFGNKEIRDQVKYYINDVINILFDYVLDIQSMPSGWSKDSKLIEAHALWLDINRDDKSFQERRKSDQWQDNVCEDFGLWINSKLSNKKMKLVKFEKDKWAQLLKKRLGLFNKGWETSK